MRSFLRWVPFGLAVVLSLVVLFAPGSDVPSGVPVSDKVVHASIFGLLAVTGVLAAMAAVPLGVGLAVYAVVSEILQGVLPIDRDGDPLDALADLGGGLLGLVVGLVLLGALRRRGLRSAGRIFGRDHRAGSVR